MEKTDSENTREHPKFAPFWKAVKADVSRSHGRFSFALLVSLILFKRTFRPVFTLRLCQAASGLPTPLRYLMFIPSRVLHQLATNQAGLDMRWRTEIGPGFKIDHGWGFVTAAKTVIGSNVTVFHGVTLGKKQRITAEGRGKSTYPVIEDEVWIGPHAVITGGVVVGHGSRIAPGTIVTGDVDPYTIVGGNPMCVLKVNAPADVVNPVALS